MTESGRNGNAREAPVRFGKLPRYIGYQVRQAQTAVFRDISRTIKPIGATPGEFSLLTLLAANPGINSITLARIYQLDKATLSLALKSLVARGFISSTRNASDRRYYCLSLTRAGRAKLRRLTRLVEKQERVMGGVLKQGERALLLDMLERIARAFGTPA